MQYMRDGKCNGDKGKEKRRGRRRGNGLEEVEYEGLKVSDEGKRDT